MLWRFGSKEEREDVEDMELVGCGRNIGLSREDVLCRSKCIIGVNQIAAVLRLIWPPSLVGDTAEFLALVSLSYLYLLIIVVVVSFYYLAVRRYIYISCSVLRSDLFMTSFVIPVVSGSVSGDSWRTPPSSWSPGRSVSWTTVFHCCIIDSMANCLSPFVFCLHHVYTWVCLFACLFNYCAVILTCPSIRLYHLHQSFVTCLLSYKVASNDICYVSVQFLTCKKGLRMQWWWFLCCVVFSIYLCSVFLYNSIVVSVIHFHDCFMLVLIIDHFKYLLMYYVWWLTI